MSAHSLPTVDHPAVHIIHDNPEWIPPFAKTFEEHGIEFVEWILPDVALDLSSTPPAGIFWSRLSASSHTRTDPHVKEYGRAVLAWLEAAGRTVINGSHVYELEVSKVRQHRELEKSGFTVPRTTAVFAGSVLADAALDFTPPFITKHNQGGKGLGVRRFDSHAELRTAAGEFAPGGGNDPIDGITLIQEYVQPAEPFITRAEFVDGRFHYAVRVDVSAGSFELCPAEACEVAPLGLAPAVCAVPGDEDEAGSASRPSDAAPPSDQFTRREEITSDTPLIRKLEEFLTEHRIRIAGVEFIEAANGTHVVYDINTNTNYNPSVEFAERAAGREAAADRIAVLLQRELSAGFAAAPAAG